MNNRMHQAMQLARMLDGQTSPNPSVGCVITKHGKVLGFGAHRFAGGPHAEVEALNMAGEAARGADLYVTLEPCNHHGKTPPCTEAILAAGIKRVFVATEDRHAIVAGQGIKRLRDAGLTVETGLLEDEAVRFYTPFWQSLERKRPVVTVKVAQSLNGIVTTGEQRLITSVAARAAGRELRATHDAILVGSETILVDDPALTLRTEAGPEPIRVVVDRRGRLPETRPSLSGRFESDILADGTTACLSSIERHGSRRHVYDTGSDFRHIVRPGDPQFVDRRRTNDSVVIFRSRPCRSS